MEHKNIAVFCGSTMGKSPIFEEKAVELAGLLADKGCNLVYGAGARGLMGVFARVMKEKGRYVVGVTPRRFQKSNEELPLEIDEYIVVDSMQERKATMYNRADAFIIFPGGTGTLDEMAEIITLKNLGFTGKPIVIYNLNGFYNGLLDLLAAMDSEGFLKKESSFAVVDTIGEVVEYLESTPSYKGSWE
ncbi:MAG: TIGR00730 family Rossman fold protein [Candidatus Ornithospirochaeta sp.]